MHSAAKPYRSVGVEGRERVTAGPHKEVRGSCLRNPRLPKTCQQSPFLGKLRRGVVGCGSLLGVRSFVLEVGSWSGSKVPVNLQLTNVLLCSDKKGHGPRTHMSPSEVTVLAEEQGSAGGSLRAGPSPDPAQLSSPRQPGTRDPTDTQLLRWPKRGALGGQFLQTASMQTTAAVRVQTRVWSEALHCPEVWAMAGGGPWRGLWSPR